MDSAKEETMEAYKPSELIGMFSAALGRQNELAKLVWLRGIYQRRQNNPALSFCYNGLRDETTQDELTLRIAKDLEKDLSDGDLITVVGLLERKIDARGSVQISLNVSRVEKLQEQAVSEADQKMLEEKDKAQREERAGMDERMKKVNDERLELIKLKEKSEHTEEYLKKEVEDLKKRMKRQKWVIILAFLALLCVSLGYLLK